MNVRVRPVYRRGDGVPVENLKSHHPTPETHSQAPVHHFVLRFDNPALGFDPAATCSESRAYLDCAKLAQYAEVVPLSLAVSLRITLNGEPYELDEPLTVADLLVRLAIDPRRVAVEHNLVILKRPLFAETLVHEGDRVEIVNFVGGG